MGPLVLARSPRMAMRHQPHTAARGYPAYHAYRAYPAAAVNTSRSRFQLTPVPSSRHVFNASSSTTFQFERLSNAIPRSLTISSTSSPLRPSTTSIRPSLQLPTSLTTLTMQQTRSHAGHSHGHHHHHDNPYLTSKNKKDPGVRITRIGLLVNLGMAASKGVGGYLFNSQALLADTFHALTDLVSDFMTLATIAWSLKPPTERFPNGYGKIESLGSLGVSGLLLAGGMLMAWNSGNTLYAHFFLDAVAAAEHALHAHSHGHGHSHAAADMIPDIKAAWLAAGTIIIKEWLYRATMKIARQQKSSVLASNAVHHRVDSLTGLVAFVAVGGAHLLQGATWLDPVGSLIVSLMVIRAGWGNTVAALTELADKAVDPEICMAVREATKKILASAPRLDLRHSVKVRDVEGVKAGPNYLMDVVLAVPEDWTVDKLRVAEVTVRDGLGKSVRGVRRVKIRFVPWDLNEETYVEEFIDPDRVLSGSPESPESHSHQNHDRDRSDSGKQQ
ncbi:MAG: hypothetical protein M1823_001439 [Watsoniomyces obsoletus]|nr:MAG: hypothetical protein M1823_001439 [Watsoniomyces obsoletus]